MSKFSHQFYFFFSKKKLFQFQKKIQYSKNQPRFCRHFQRLLRRTSFIQFLMIRQMLQIQFNEIKKTNCFSLQKIQLSKQFLKSKEYCSFLNTQINYKLWILSIVPLLKANKRTFLTGKKSSQIYLTFHRFLKTSFIQYIMIYQISNFWSSKNKLWILSNVVIEKKFIINWLKNENRLKLASQAPIFQFNNRDSIRLKTLIQYFPLINIHQFLKENLSVYSPLSSTEFSLQQKKNQLFTKKVSELNSIKFNIKKNDFLKTDRNSDMLSFIFQINQINLIPFEFLEYNHFLFFPLTYETKNQSKLKPFQTIFSNIAEFHGLNLKCVKLYPISNGVDFLGWHFKKELSNFHAHASHANVRSHQKELKKYLKTSYSKKSADQIIFGLNNKIKIWKEFYGLRLLDSQDASSPKQIYFSYLQLNDYLFWRIWHWIQKRHRNKSSKWLYSRYWKRSPSNHQWIFSINNASLISYK